MKVLIISGGTSSERKISLISAKGVGEALKQEGFEVKIFDLKKGYPELKKLAKKFDVIFPVIHGEEGEGGKLHKFLSKTGKPFVGGSWKGFKKGWYKIPCKIFCDQNNIPTAAWKKIKTIEDVKRFGLPCVAKSTNGGSSKEVVILKTPADLKKSLFLNLFKLNQPLYVEKFLPGTEITVGILDNKALPVMEIIPPQSSAWFDYKSKYSGETREIPDAPSISPEARKQAQDIALKIHQTLNLGPYSRIDFIVPSHISSGNTNPQLLEVNTIPGMTPTSLFPKAAQAAGYTFPKLVKKLIELSL